MDLDLDEILRVATAAAKLAGAELRLAMRGGGSQQDEATQQQPHVDHKASRSTDLVTATDRKCEALVMAYIRQHYPDHAVIGEESNAAEGSRYVLTDAPTWTIDPIDGTTNFVHGLALTCVLVGFLVDGKPMVGVTYDPNADELFTAIRGRGAFLTSGSTTRPMRVSGTTAIRSAVVSMDAGYGREVADVQRYVAVQQAVLLQRVRHVRVLGCCGLTLAYVACGRLDAAWEEGSWEADTGPKIWDFTVGALLVEEAGGVTRDLTQRRSKDTPLDLRQRSVFSAASPELAQTLLDIMYAAA